MPMVIPAIMAAFAVEAAYVVAVAIIITAGQPVYGAVRQKTKRAIRKESQ